MKHGLIKVATASPTVTVADCEANLSEMLRVWKNAERMDVALLVYPELSITGSTCADLFFSSALLQAAKSNVLRFLRETRDSDIISIIGFPLVVNDKLYNSAAICQKGRILGIIPKTTAPNDHEHCEARYFASYTDKTIEIPFGDGFVPFGPKQIFACITMPTFRLGVEIGVDLWLPAPPSNGLCAAGALIIANPAASGEAVAKDDYRRLLLRAQSAKTICGYLYANCGKGESTTDLVFGGHSMIWENGICLAETLPFAFPESGLTVSEVDTEHLSCERRRNSIYDAPPSTDYRIHLFERSLTDTHLTRTYDPAPFIPQEASELSKRANLILTMQSRGLAQRVEKAYAKKCVIGISGGLDSCLAILVAAKTMDVLGRPRTDIIGVTMPCFGTTKRTRSNAELLCEELGAELRCVDISNAVRCHFSDIGHSEDVKNVVYENAQARERTQVIMDIANMENGLVVGTGDLSELALGWATYNGDHMSMYGVNGGVPKTLIRHIVSHYAAIAEAEGKSRLAAVLRDILDTPISPELLPADENDKIAQKTEDLVGPYELHDFYLYYMVRCSFAPDKLYRIAKIAFAGKYSDEILLKWLKNFIRRFFAQQFKRSCLPDGPKVGSISFSPRGDWKMPSDASAKEWMRIAEQLQI